jgi:6-phosphofructokinase 2
MGNLRIYDANAHRLKREILYSYLLSLIAINKRSTKRRHYFPLLTRSREYHRPTSAMTKIATLTLNPAVDISVEVERIEPIHKLRCISAKREAGGGGINVARVVSRLDGDVVAIYAAGGAIGELLRTLVAQESVPSLTVPIAEESRENFAAFEKESGQQYRFVVPGPRLSEPEWRACLDALATLDARPEFIVASGSLPPGVPDAVYEEVAKVAKAKDAKFILDSSGAALKAALAEGAYLIKPNLRELRTLVGEHLEGKAAWVEACRKLVNANQAQVVALTLGDQGALLVTSEQAWFAKAVPVKPVSAIGAGDSFLGALVWALSSGRCLEDALRYGVAAGSSALLTPGTSLCRREDVERLVGDIKLEAI